MEASLGMNVNLLLAEEGRKSDDIKNVLANAKGRLSLMLNGPNSRGPHQKWLALQADINALEGMLEKPNSRNTRKALRRICTEWEFPLPESFSER